MRRSVIVISAMMMLMACGSKKAQGESVDAAVPDSAVILAQEEMTGVIKELYVAEAKNEGGIDQLYACHVWRKMVDAVNEKDAHVAEIGFFNENYWTQMQDGNPADLEARDIKFEQVDVEKGRAVVSFLLHSSVQDVRQKFEFCHEDGNWRVHNIIRYFQDADGKEEESNLLEGMRSYLGEPLEVETQELTFANMAGIYDDEKQEERICLYEEGRATWGMVGSLNYTEYTYTINGNTICLKSIDDESEDDCYVYDENTRTLKNKQGEVYYRQVVD